MYTGPVLYEPVSDVQTCTTRHPNYYISEYSDRPVRYNPYSNDARHILSGRTSTQADRSYLPHHRRVQQTSSVRNLANLLDRTSARQTSLSSAWQQKNEKHLQEQEEKAQVQEN